MRGPWADAWGPVEQESNGDQVPPGEWPPSGNRCFRCPGAELRACCQHGEWVAYAKQLIAGYAQAEPQVDGLQGRRRRWAIVAYIVQKLRRAGYEIK